MARPAPPIPVASLTGPVRLADAARLGVPRHELLTPRWQRVGRGVRLWQGLDPRLPGTRIRAVLLDVPPGAVLGGWAALWWQGVTALDGLTGPGGGVPVPVLVHVGTRGHLRARPGIVVDRSRLPDCDVVEVRGVRVVTPSRALLDIACRAGVEEGVVAGDAACAAGLIVPEQLTDDLARRRGTRGVPRARAAARLVVPGARSTPESRLRFVWVVEAGLPPPLVNARVLDRGDGRLTGVVDLLDEDAALAGEYDGSQHRELAAHTADNLREEELERLGLLVMRVTALDLWPGRRRLVQRLRARRAQGMARDRCRDRWVVGAG